MIGNTCGSVDSLEISMKKMKLKGNVELNYLSASQIRVVLKDIHKEALVKSIRDLEILKINVVKHFITAYTNQTLIVCNG